jgi:TolB-like protein/Flp pilus assembly protein TadD/DNA-binding winged helix-turn-helix (wHTH) protein
MKTAALLALDPGKGPGMDPNTTEAPDPSLAGYQVDDLIVDIGQQRVTRNGAEIPLPHLSFELLVTLARAAPNLVTFDQLTSRVWPGLVITPETISQRVKLVRAALGDDPHAPRYITGVRGRGYRMVAAVRPLNDSRPAPEPVARVTPYWMDEKKPEAALPADESAGAGRPDAPGTTDVAPPSAVPGTFGWVGAALVVLALLAVPWAVTRFLYPGPASSTAQTVLVQPPRSIAVLPLIDTSPGGGNAYLGEGLAQELSARLSRIRGLRVASRTSTSAIKDRDVHTIAQTLGVRHVLEGSVHREGDQLRVTAQLVDASTGYNIWSQTYNRTWQDLLAIEDDVARSITSTLKVVLSNQPSRDSHPATTNVEAFDLYLSGLAKLNGPGGADDLEEAGASFRRALAVDPKFALAYAGLCERYVKGYERTSDTTLIPQAESACGQALKLDDSLREVSAALAHLYLVSGRFEQAAAIYQGLINSDPENADGYIGLGHALDGLQRTADAEHALRQGIEAEPTYWLAQRELGTFLFHHGRATEAIPVYRRVTQLVPASPGASNDLGAALEMTGDFTGAASAYERSLALAPTHGAYSNLGSVYYFLGRFPDAVRVYSRAAELTPADQHVWGNLAEALWQIPGRQQEAEDTYRRAIALAQKNLEVNAKDAASWAQLAYYHARVGDQESAARYLQRAIAADKDNLFVYYYGALVALARGDSSAALDALERAVALGYPPLLVRAAPDFVSLRNDARFRKLIVQADRPAAG